VYCDLCRPYPAGVNSAREVIQVDGESVLQVPLNAADLVRKIATCARIDVPAIHDWGEIVAFQCKLPAMAGAVDALEWHWIAVTRGSTRLRYRLGPTAFTTDANCQHEALSFIPALTPSTWESSKPLSVVNILVSATFLHHACEAFGVEEANRQPFVGAKDACASSLTWLLENAMARPAEMAHVYAGSIATAIVGRVALALAHPQPQPTRKAMLGTAQLRRATDFIHANAGHEIVLKDIAAAAGLSEFHFARAFRAATGTTPHAYLTTVRVESARRLIESSDLPILDVALRSGFSTRVGLNRAFQRTYGINPSAFRAQMKTITEFEQDAGIVSRANFPEDVCVS
jgi:AraC-like DNA-binding protein